MIRPSPDDVGGGGHDDDACGPIAPPERLTWRAALRGHVIDRHLAHRRRELAGTPDGAALP